MGKRSVKEDKSIYQLSREEQGLTRAQASELMGFLSESRIEKIENRRSSVYPDEILAMAKAYKKPSLCNSYCANECPIGQQYVPEIEVKELSQIVIEMLASLNALTRQKDRMVEIIADGQVDDEELRDFIAIQDGLEKVSLVAETLKLWVNNTVASGAIDAEKVAAIRAQMKK